jgi:hypothetical protein
MLSETGPEMRRGFSKTFATFYVMRVYSYMNTERSNSTLNPTPTGFDDASLPSDVPTLQTMIRELVDALKKEQHEREGIQKR